MKHRLITTLILLTGLTACQKDHMFDCFKSTGDVVTESRDAAAFENLYLEDDVDVVIHPDTDFYIKVTAGENLIDGIITELSGNTLYVRNENRCNWVRSFKNTYTVEVGMNKPLKIDYYGSGNISCADTIRTDEFTFDCWNGSGSVNFLFNCQKTHINNNTGRADIHAIGYSGVSYVYINDVATFDGSALTSYYTYIKNISTGDCRVNAKVELNAEIDYHGNIYYTGNPATVNKTITGDGMLIAF